MKKIFLLVSAFTMLMLLGAGCGKTGPTTEPSKSPAAASAAPSAEVGERVDFFDDSYGESSTINLPKYWGYALAANPSWVTSMKINTFRIFSGEGLDKNHLWIYIVPDKADNQDARTDFEKAAKPEIVKTARKILPSYRFYAEYVTDDADSRGVFASIAEKSAAAAPTVPSAEAIIAPEKYVGKWTGLEVTTFDGAPATNSVVLNSQQAGTRFSGKLVAVLSAAAPAIRTLEGDMSGEFTVPNNSSVNFRIVGTEKVLGAASLNYQKDGTLLWKLNDWKSTGDYRLPSEMILYRDQTDELDSGEKQKMEKAAQAKINADPEYKQKAFAHTEQILGSYARVGVQTYAGDDVARVYVKQTPNGWEAITGAIPLNVTDIKSLNLGIPAPLF
ncbi:MAG: hypothetical protein HW383_91 [Candidatus Magasanikbacteria bacterium]|nr:hypothetical protein [Candidatus Magasanikbacteria bacterium]